ncbi:MAG: PQQ-binding-like beta-propeller repeat protein [Trueperaceae bacterium]
MNPPRPFKARQRALLALVLALLLGAAGVHAQVTTSWYQGPVLPEPQLQAMQVRPVWRDQVDAANAVVTDTGVVYLRGGRLVATELASGWQQWSYGSGLTGPLTLVLDTVLVAEGGSVTALDAHTGEVRWTTHVSDLPVRSLMRSGDALLVTSGTTATSALLDLRSGHADHWLNLPAPGAPAFVADDVVLFSVSSGEPASLWYHAFDPRSGRELWRGAGWRQVLAVEQGLVYMLNQGGVVEAGFSISVVDAVTGNRVDHWRYEFGGRVAAWVPGSGRLTLTGEALYVTDASGERVFRFPRGGAQAPVASYRVEGSRFLVGPHLGLLFFEGVDSGQLTARSSHDGRLIGYLGPGANVSRLDLSGTTAYVGRTDGTFLALDLRTARAHYLLSSGGTGFGATVEAGDYVVVQSSSEVLVLEAPR